ncbi:MAG: hypothetical protein IPL88_08115 [Rhizobiales bacterium]|nr:hypothetical protein [Hyphomicrobiales bacterium]
MAANDAQRPDPAKADASKSGTRSGRPRVVIQFVAAKGQTVRMPASSGKLGLSLPTDPPPNPLMATPPPSAKPSGCRSQELQIVYRARRAGRPV